MSAYWVLAAHRWRYIGWADEMQDAMCFCNFYSYPMKMICEKIQSGLFCCCIILVFFYFFYIFTTWTISFTEGMWYLFFFSLESINRSRDKKERIEKQHRYTISVNFWLGLPAFHPTSYKHNKNKIFLQNIIACVSMINSEMITESEFFSHHRWFNRWRITDLEIRKRKHFSKF